VFRRKVWRHARMKNADWPRLWLKNESSESDVAARTHTQYNNNDRSGTTRLSKIAHIGSIDVSSSDCQEMQPSGCTMRIRSHASALGAVSPNGCVRRRQIEFAATIETDLICAVLDREDTAEVMMPAAKKELEHTPEKFHKSCARCRRSQLPLASSHSSSERTLARASAIAQSAAP
jgi:hypothetical protein